MSTLRVNTLQNTSTTDGGISINNSGHVTVDGVAMPSSGPLSNRNLIINGAMQVAQRGTQVTGVTTGGYRTVDRFTILIDNLGTWTVDQSTDSPNGFSNSLKLTCTTADASPAAGDYAFIRQNIEAQNLQSLGYGTADAKTMTLSFWVKSNKTGSASVDSRQVDNSVKLWSATYSISAADTWEYKTLTIPEDTAGVIDNDNNTGLYIDWWLNSGSTFTGGTAASTWSTNDESRRNPSNLGVGGATSDYFAITGVQLEVGSVATPFEHRSYGDELARCQRYYYRHVTHGQPSGTAKEVSVASYYSGTQIEGYIQFPVTMRTAPSADSSNGTNHFIAYRANGSDSFNNCQIPGETSFTCAKWFNATEASGSAGNAANVVTNNASAYLGFNAEL